MGIYAAKFKADNSEYVRVSLSYKNGTVYGTQLVTKHRRRWVLFNNPIIQIFRSEDIIRLISNGGTAETSDSVIDYGSFDISIHINVEQTIIIPEEIHRLPRAFLVFGPGSIQNIDGEIIFIYPRFQYLILGTEITQNYLPIVISQSAV